MTNPKSEGECLYCKQKFLKPAINRHLQKHLADKAKNNKAGQSFLLKVDTNPRWGNSPYFLSLWADGETTVGDIDDFLRSIWLECCGHMSAFTDPKNKHQGGGGMWSFFEAESLLAKGKTKEYEKMMEEANGEIPNSRKLKAALAKSMKINYEYDFGSTTELQLTVVDEYPVKADKNIVLLSRNEPPEILCEACGTEPAIQICSACVNDKNIFCKKCAKQHAKTCSDFAEYAAMPLVNSPRAGVCAYDGGTIDKQRDGVFVKR